MTDRSQPAGAPGTADAHTVRLTVNPDNDHVRNAVTDATFCRYLRRAHNGAVTTGDTWSEFVSAGCGTRTNVSIRVLAVEGGTHVGRETIFEWG